MSGTFRLSRRGVLGGAASALAIPLLANKSLASITGGDSSFRLFEEQYEVEPTARYMNSAATLPNGMILLTGGYPMSDMARNFQRVPASANVQIYDPSYDVYYSAAAMSTPRARHASVALRDGRIAVLGGFNLFPLNSVEIYDPYLDTWSHGGELPHPMFDHAVALSGSTVILSGGHSGASAIAFEISTHHQTFNP